MFSMIHLQSPTPITMHRLANLAILLATYILHVMNEENSSSLMSDPEVIAGIRRIVLDHKRNSKRVNALSLYQERISVDGASIMQKSTVQKDDAPEIEQILKYRDQVEEMDKSLAMMKRLAEEDQSIKNRYEYAKAIESIGKLRMESMRSIDRILSEMRKDFTHKERIMAALATEAAKLAQGQTQHVDKIRVAEMAVLRGKTQPDDTGSKLEQLAARYNMTVEEVKAHVKDAMPLVITEED